MKRKEFIDAAHDAETTMYHVAIDLSNKNPF